MTDETKMILDEIKGLKTEIANVRTELKTDIKDIRMDIKDIQMTLENVTNKNIQVLAEGHLNLNRKLDEVLEVSSQNKMLLIRVNSLENEVRRLREKIER